MATQSSSQALPKKAPPKKTALKTAAAKKAASSTKTAGRAKVGAARASAKPAAPARKKSKKKAAARRRVQAVPAQYGAVTPSLVVSPCSEALEFYQRAFGAKLKGSIPGPNGLLMHAEISIGGAMIMLADEMPPMNGQSPRKSPKNAGSTTGGIVLYVKDADAVFARAIAAGAKATMPLEDQFWGDRFGQLEDPFGHIWAVATHTRDVSMKEMRAAMAQMSPPGVG
jgi:PhnB protein